MSASRTLCAFLPKAKRTHLFSDICALVRHTSTLHRNMFIRMNGVLRFLLPNTTHSEREELYFRVRNFSKIRISNQLGDFFSSSLLLNPGTVKMLFWVFVWNFQFHGVEREVFLILPYAIDRFDRNASKFFCYYGIKDIFSFDFKFRRFQSTERMWHRGYTRCSTEQTADGLAEAYGVFCRWGHGIETRGCHT